MEKLKELRMRWAENESAYKDAQREHSRKREDLKSEIISLAKYKVGDKVKYSSPRDWRDREVEPLFGIIERVVASSRWDHEISPQYVVHKINKNGSMHKTANITYGSILEKNLEIVE